MSRMGLMARGMVVLGTALASLLLVAGAPGSAAVQASGPTVQTAVAQGRGPVGRAGLPPIGDRPGIDVDGVVAPGAIVAANHSKLDSVLLALSRSARGVGDTPVAGGSGGADPRDSATVAAAIAQSQLRLTGSMAQVYVEWATRGVTAPASITAAGGVVERTDASQRITQARVPAAGLAALASSPLVRDVRLPDYPVLNTGSQTTAGHALLNFDDLRTAAGVDGTGITVGVISDGINGLAASIALGDLPATTETRSSGKLTATSGGVIAQSFRSDNDLEAGLSGGTGAEGTAMLEIVHDIAPGAQLRFANFSTSIEFKDAVNFLAGVCDVVVDDISWFGALAYDGTNHISQNTSDALANAGNPIRVYTNAVANFAKKHYEDSTSAPGPISPYASRGSPGRCTPSPTRPTPSMRGGWARPA